MEEEINKVVEELQKGFIVIGDTHGNHRFISHRIKSLKLSNFILLHVGDFGVGFEKNHHTELLELRRLNDTLASFNSHLYVIRGNHDDPNYFTGEHNYSHLHLMPDYSVIDVNGDKILMVGGAVSIDRKQRKNDMLANSVKGIDQPSYWYDEIFKLDVDKLKDLEDITYVVTHSCPKYVSPINDFNNHFGSHGMLVEHFVVEGDSTLKNDLNIEREDIATMYDILVQKNKIKKWFYGHFHTSNAEYYGETDFITVNINQFYNVIQ